MRHWVNLLVSLTVEWHTTHIWIWSKGREPFIVDFSRPSRGKSLCIKKQLMQKTQVFVFMSLSSVCITMKNKYHHFRVNWALSQFKSCILWKPQPTKAHEGHAFISCNSQTETSVKSNFQVYRAFPGFVTNSSSHHNTLLLSPSNHDKAGNFCACREGARKVERFSL